MTELEQSLRALGRELDVPDEPDLRARVGERLAARGKPRRALRPALVVALALVAAALVAALLVPGARTAILRFLHLRGESVELVDTLPPAKERPLLSGFHGPVSARAAGSLLGFRVRLPLDVRAPRVYTAGGFAAIILRGPKGQPLLLAETRGNELGVVKKVAYPATAEYVRVGGRDGIWLSGAHHVVTFGTGTSRIAGNTLAWQAGDLTLRVEGKGLTLPEALRIARSTR
ncbi:MAG: hypothetical protein QOE36_3131 [Gaiellaceae bacterium]|nr:hypothetical protein [Gaiellaceae bacterium]